MLSLPILCLSTISKPQIPAAGVNKSSSPDLSLPPKSVFVYTTDYWSSYISFWPHNAEQFSLIFMNHEKGSGDAKAQTKLISGAAFSFSLPWRRVKIESKLWTSHWTLPWSRCNLVKWTNNHHSAQQDRNNIIITWRPVGGFRCGFFF